MNTRPLSLTLVTLAALGALANRISLPSRAIFIGNREPDEPFYAAYLAATGIDHPMRDEVLAALQKANQNNNTAARVT